MRDANWNVHQNWMHWYGCVCVGVCANMRNEMKWNMLAIKTTQKFLLIFISFAAVVVVLCLFFVVLFCFLFQLLFPFCCLLCSSFWRGRGGDGGENVFRCVFNHKTNYAALQATSAATTTATNNANNCKIFIIKTC